MGKTHLCRGQSIKPEFSRRVDAAARWRRWLALAALLSVAALASAQPWRTLGPDGGDVRSLAHDPKDPDRIFLGTSAGSLYLSVDGGANWTRYAQLGNSRDLVLDRIAIDPSDPATMYVAAWSIESSNGDLFRTRDGGKTWNTLLAMHGKSVRSLTIAPSDPKTLVAGSRDGVYRTRDSGETWERISPENHAEIKNIESVAVAPDNADVIYAGTRHLPWKTEDGGQHWHSIKKGIIDDSDVFSIIIDSANPSTVYASACSGIYKSESAGELFRKIQGIPFSARRTRVLRMDPADHRVVYAGTTEGLWKTGDAGATWKRVTGANVVVNDILLDPRNTARILMATDRGGVLASNDAERCLQPPIAALPTGRWRRYWWTATTAPSCMQAF
ncbi:MAG TPA: YCF48-related protein [Candidatus Angelobacter sp.]|nr:YCF48-related protein [Candidatus Angelobacter sp.]